MALLRSTRIVRSIQETCCHSNTSEKPSANAGVKNSQRSKIICNRIASVGYVEKEMKWLIT